ncbi:MAG TPA: GNAT family N-acetyltransferase [Devosia sp.]|nr:GNAT family N-acetyltransferase [Devosia sp.]
MNLTVHRLKDIPAETWLPLLNHPEVRRHMPLAGDTVWTDVLAMEWAAGKDAQWTDNGFGPWALRVDGVFAGWGGFQKEGEDADFGLVLLPEFWGRGFAIARDLFDRDRASLGSRPISILLPPSRTRMKGLARLGFLPDGELDYDGHRFLKFRLLAP